MECNDLCDAASSSDRCSCDETAVNAENSSEKTELYLSLDNFDGDDVPDDCPFVLTSPRSLEACKIVGVRPVDLLPFRIQDARRQLEIEGDFTFEALNILRNAEDERRELLETCRTIRSQLILSDNLTSCESEEITTDSGKGYTSEGTSSSRSSPERIPRIQRARKTNVISRFESLEHHHQDKNYYESPDQTRPLQKYSHCHNLSDFQIPARSPSSLDSSSKRSSVVTFCDEPTLVYHQVIQNPHRPTSSSKQLFCNPYGPPLYPRQRLSKLDTLKPSTVASKLIKKKARRKRKMVTLKVLSSPIEKNSLKPNLTRKDFSKGVSMKEIKKAFECHDILHHDRVILEKLAMKRLKESENKSKSQSFQRQWNLERKQWVECQKSHHLLWQNLIAKKRELEAHSNEVRLMEARKKVIESQEKLRWLILQKADRAERAVAWASRLKTQRFLRWRAGEDARRMAVEEALAELLARDTQYRKDLKAHIEQRLQFAEQRRWAILHTATKRKIAWNQETSDIHTLRMTEVAKKHLLHIEAVREAIQKRLERAAFIVAKNMESQKKESRTRHFDQVLSLKAELESKLDLWRKQVLKVQSASLERAEFHAKEILDQRRLKAAAEYRERQSRHRDRLSKVQIDLANWRSQQMQHYQTKMAFHDKMVAKKRKDHQERMKKAKRAADLRQIVKGISTMEELMEQTAATSKPITMEIQIAKVNFEEAYFSTEPVVSL